MSRLVRTVPVPDVLAAICAVTFFCRLIKLNIENSLFTDIFIKWLIEQ